nr:hypothetical protein MtrunA17_Chr2g0333841 [Ipomoea batatas]GME04111.1 hypothetical protein MtrunA17_Chr2g0333841 [Ipomoea batatas]
MAIINRIYKLLEILPCLVLPHSSIIYLHNSENLSTGNEFQNKEYFCLTPHYLKAANNIWMPYQLHGSYFSFDLFHHFILKNLIFVKNLESNMLSCL